MLECKYCVGYHNVRICGVHEVQEWVYEQSCGAKGVYSVAIQEVCSLLMCVGS